MHSKSVRNNNCIGYVFVSGSKSDKLSKQEFIDFLTNTDISINIYSGELARKLGPKNVSYILEERSHILIRLKFYTNVLHNNSVEQIIGEIYTSYKDSYKNLITVNSIVGVNNEVICDKDLDPSIIHQIVNNKLNDLGHSGVMIHVMDYDSYKSALGIFTKLLNYAIFEKKRTFRSFPDAVFFDVWDIRYKNDNLERKSRAVLFGLLNPIEVSNIKYIRYLDLSNIFNSIMGESLIISNTDKSSKVNFSETILNSFDVKILKEKILDFDGGRKI